MKKTLRTAILIALVCALMCGLALPASAIGLNKLHVKDIKTGATLTPLKADGGTPSGSDEVVKFSLTVTGLQASTLYFLIMVPATFDGDGDIESVPTWTDDQVLYANQYKTGEDGTLAIGEADKYLYPKSVSNSVVLLSGGTGDAKLVKERISSVELDGATVTGTISGYFKTGAPAVALYNAAGTEKLITGSVTVVTASAAEEPGSSTFEISGVQAGSYVIKAEKELNVSLSVPVTVTTADVASGAAVAAGDVVMYCGDINGDGSITGTDLSYLTTGYNKTAAEMVTSSGDSNYTKADLNEDGSITGTDLSYITTAYNQPRS